MKRRASRALNGPGTRRTFVGIGAAGIGFLVAAGLALGLSSATASKANALAGCRIYVASGDDIAAGHDLNDDTKRYPEQLLNDHIKSPGWCLYNQAKNSQTSSSYIS